MLVLSNDYLSICAFMPSTHNMFSEVAQLYLPLTPFCNQYFKFLRRKQINDSIQNPHNITWHQRTDRLQMQRLVTVLQNLVKTWVSVGFSIQFINLTVFSWCPLVFYVLFPMIDSPYHQKSSLIFPATVPDGICAYTTELNALISTPDIVNIDCSEACC